MAAGGGREASLPAPHTMMMKTDILARPRPLFAQPETVSGHPNMTS
ncbi:MAG: hypothetical protein LBI02_09005 [Opitutaceae bacterium]|jgi:hypothetical protein|nr:hypothetical protein [Opitutaceae bacterium]